jgi:ankyrin repeat protein/CRP-like cAMP-binding protein
MGIGYAAPGTQASLTASYVSLLGLLQLGRMYRVALLFRHMTYNMAVSLLVTTLVRNLTLTFYLLHWAACAFYFIARQQTATAIVRGLPEPLTWWTNKNELITTVGTPQQYAISFYWSIVTFATLGYGDISPNGMPEVVFVIVYVAVNVIAMAYIVGTTTLLVTKGDQRIGRYRDRMAALTSYCATNGLSQQLKASMAGMLKLHMSLADDLVADETLLAVYPTTVRRRILRELYGRQLAGCYLLEGVGQKFLDALMVGARVEMFMPRVEVVAAGDHVNELYIVVAGHMEVVEPSSAAAVGGGAGGNGGDGGGNGGDASRRQSAAPDADGPATPVKSGYGATEQLGRGASSGGGGGGVSANGGGWQDGGPVAVPIIPEEGGNGGGGGGGGFSGGGNASSGGGGGGLGRGSTVSPFADLPPRSSSMIRQLVRSFTGGAGASGRSGDGGAAGHDNAPLGRGSGGHNSGSNAPLGRGSGGNSSNSPALGRTSSLPATAFEHPGAYYRPRRGHLPRMATDPAAAAAAAAMFGASSRLPGAGGGGPDGSDPAAAGTDALAAGAALPPEVQAAVASSGSRVLGPGDAFAEVAFFTEAPKAESVRALTVCRLLVVSRATYNALAADFPVSARRVLENLKERAERLVEELVPAELAGQLMTADGRFGGEAAAAVGATGAAAAAGGAAARKPPTAAPPPPAPSAGARSGTTERPLRSLGTLSVPLFHGAAVAAAAEGLNRGGGAGPAGALHRTSPLGAATANDQEAAQPAQQQLTVAQQRLCADLVRLRQMVRRAAARHDLSRVQALLTAAAGGDADTVAALVTRGGMPPDAADYEGRTALMVASGRGHRDVVLMLLFLGADPRKADARGATPLMAAAEGGFPAIVDVLVRHGATLGLDPVIEAATLCKAVHEGRMSLLRTLLRAGARASAQDYDGQAPLHAAAAEGNLAAAKILVETPPGADPLQADRWGRTPLDVALRARATPVVEYLAQKAGEEAAAAARASWAAECAEDLLAACAEGDAGEVARLLAAEGGAPPDAADYGGRPAAAVAAARGHLECVKLLLAAGADPAAADGDGRTLLHEAAARGDVGVLQAVAEAEGGGGRSGGAGAAGAAAVVVARPAGYHWSPRDRLGCTPLDDARRAGKEAAVAFLEARERR